MPLFKTYFKILKKNLVTILVYFVVFVGMTSMMSSSGSPFKNDIETAKLPIAIFNNDEGAITNDFLEYLDDYFIIKDMNEKRARDALFYRDIYAVITIYDGFSNMASLPSENIINIEGIENSAVDYQVSLIVSKYISMLRYLSDSGISQNDLPTEMKGVRETIKTQVSVEEVESNKKDYTETLVFVNFSAYIIMGGLLTLITVVMRSFKDGEIKRRMDISQYSLTKVHGSMLVSNLVFSYLFFTAIIVIGYAVNPNRVVNGLFILNMLVFTLQALSVAYLISMFFKSIKVLGAMSQVIALAPAFITGVFIPQVLIDPTVLSVSRIFPYYWYVSANTAITVNDMSRYFTSIGVVIGYTLVFVAAAVLISLKQRRSENI